MTGRMLDCGCYFGDEGRIWCPTCLDPPKPIQPPQIALLEAQLQTLKNERDYLLGELSRLKKQLEAALAGDAKE